MIRRPPRSTPLSLHDALPICQLVPAGSIIASHPREDRRRALADKYGIQVTADNAEAARRGDVDLPRSEEHTSELQSLAYVVCRLLLEKKKQPDLIASYCAP